tara:strand:- start:846 stop:1073 length:228 start_codon:yes stop_codon:yes gene_type:complete
MRYMKAIRMILGGTVFFTVVLAIMLAPAMIMATCFGVTQTVFLALLLPCAAFGFLIGFQIMSLAVDKGLFENLLN